MFLVGHGYAPVITVRDGEGDVAYRGPAVFLPQDSSFVSFGVVKAPSARPGQIGLEGLFFPTDLEGDGEPASVFPDDLDPLVSMTVWTGDLGYDSGVPQSVFVLDTTKAEQVDEGRRPAVPASTCARASGCSCPTGSARWSSRASSRGCGSR